MEKKSTQDESVPVTLEISSLHSVSPLAPQVVDHPPSLCSPIKEPFSPLSNVVSSEQFRGCYVRAQPFDEFPSSNRRYLPPQVCHEKKTYL